MQEELPLNHEPSLDHWAKLRATQKLYTVKLELQETVKADNPEDAKQKFKDNFDWSDINYGTYKVTLAYKDVEETT